MNIITPALNQALLTVLSKPVGHSVSLPASYIGVTDIKEFCEEHDLLFWLNGRTLSLQKKKAYGFMRRDFIKAFPGVPSMINLDGGFSLLCVEKDYQAWSKSGREGVTV
ncbi:hypothetical protein UFOVP813_2 [uncultured Caudovirales phage]|uniref:Uncharacterized protein n=1 Tax=uncultured Caudovirales phage TaxID=2100421 RepID=A0A6J5NWH5_9CAUD|nr:hypothetical protein UFOVP813_2 [uncultured Caudovirales phage]